MKKIIICLLCLTYLITPIFATDITDILYDTGLTTPGGYKIFEKYIQIEEDIEIPIYVNSDGEPLDEFIEYDPWGNEVVSYKEKIEQYPKYDLYLSNAEEGYEIYCGSFQSGESYTLPYCPYDSFIANNDPKALGYVFEYWNSEYGQKYYPGDEIIIPNCDLTLYPHFKAIYEETFVTISFIDPIDSNEVMPPLENVKAGTTIKLPECIHTKPQSKFYAYNDSRLTSNYYFLEEDYIVPFENVTLYPIFEVTSYHTHSYTTTVISPTCTEKGYTTYTCECGDSYPSDYVNALSHDFSAEYTVDIHATTTSVGQKSRHCSRCDEVTDVTEIPKIVTLIDSSKRFTDVPSSAWYKGYIDYVVTHSLMNGTTDTSFSPTGTMNRAMLVTVLWRMEGSPEPTNTPPFTDLTQSWYMKAVAWAWENNIVSGTSATTFSPDSNVTREQIAKILHYFSDYKGYDVSASADLSVFPDESKISSWAYDSISWANAEGLISGASTPSGTILNPLGSATRAEAATVLMRFCENH